MQALTSTAKVQIHQQAPYVYLQKACIRQNKAYIHQQKALHPFAEERLDGQGMQ
jgi:hypothetical protein